MVQIDPGPIPTFIASAPDFTNLSAALAVATFPTTMSIFLYFDLTFFSMSITPFVSPWAVSITIASTDDTDKASALSNVSLVTPTAAATLYLP